MGEPIPYEQWSDDEHARWVQMGNTFGRHLVEYARDYASQGIPKDASSEATTVAQKALQDALYGVMMILDNVTANRIDDQYRVEYVLTARIMKKNTDTSETIELSPGGDGLCAGFHGWTTGY